MEKKKEGLARAEIDLECSAAVVKGWGNGDWAWQGVYFVSVYSEGQDAVAVLSGLGFWCWVFAWEEKQGKKEFYSWDYVTAEAGFF